MEGNKNKPRALLVFGAPCSGKTTFGEKFAKKFNLAFYDLDALMEEDNFTRKNLLKLIELITRTRQTFILEGGLSTERQRNEVRKIIQRNDYKPALVWVQTDAATIRARLKNRYKNISDAKDAYEKAINEIEAPTNAEKPIILSGKHTFETQVRHVIAGLADLNTTK